MIALAKKWGLPAACLATVAWVWWLEASPSDPAPDRSVETYAARRARLEELLDREVQVDVQGEHVRDELARLCQQAGVPTSSIAVEPAPHGDDPLDPDPPHARWPPFRLRYPVRLRSALNLVGPRATWDLQGQTLRLGPRRPSMRTYPVALPTDTRGPLVALGFIVEGGWRKKYTPAEFPLLANGTTLLSPADELPEAVPASLVVSAWPGFDDRLQELLDVERSAAEGRLAGVVRIGETAAGRDRQAVIEAALERTIDVSFQGEPLEKALGTLEERLGVNLFLDRSSLEAEGHISEPVTIEARLPARSALRHLLDSVGLTFVIMHDVVFVTTPISAGGHRPLRAYPTAHLLRGERRLTNRELIQTIGAVGPQSVWSVETGGFGNPSLRYAGNDVLFVEQSDDVQEEIERLLHLLAWARDPAVRLAVGPELSIDPWEQRLQGPGVPLSGPLTLEELAQRLTAACGRCVLIHRQVLSDERLEAGRVAFAGDDGEGTLDEQLTRMLADLELSAVVRDDALVLLPGSRDQGVLEYHATPRLADPLPLVPLLLAPSANLPPPPSDPRAFVASAVVSHALPWGAAIGDPTDGILARLPRLEHAKLRRLLAPGPVRDLLEKYVRSPPRLRRALLTDALQSDSTAVRSMARSLMEASGER